MGNKHLLLGSVSALAMGLLAAPTFAQDQDIDTVETVVVTGIRASLQSAQSIKENADQVVDAITAVDIGALPDNSVAEALQRVPGIQITRTDQVSDPLRWAGYGNGVFVRGLSWVKSLTNGEEIFGAENGRSISFADISADLMAGVEVFKNPNAKMIEGGVGGTINLKTHKPFDFDSRRIAASGNLSMGMLSNHATPSINMLYSDRFQTKIGEIGVLFSVDYQNLLSTNNVVSTDPWGLTATDDDGNTLTYPKGYTNTYGMIGYRHMDWKQPRVAMDLTLQWRPVDSLEITFTGLFTKAEPQSNEHNVAWMIPTANSSSSYNIPYAARDTDAIAESIATYTYDKNGYWTGGTLYNAVSSSTQANYFDTRFDARHHISKNFELNAKWNPDDHWEFVIDANYIDSRATMSSLTLYNEVKNSAYRTWNSTTSYGNFFPDADPVNVTVDISDDSPYFSYDSASKEVLATQSNYLWAAAMDHYENNYAHAYTTRADASYTFDGDGFLGWIKSVDFGFRTNLKQAITRNSGWHWGRIGFKSWAFGGCTGVSTDTTTTEALATCTNAIPSFADVASDATHFYNFPDVFGQSMPSVWEPTMGWLKHPYRVWSDVQDILAMADTSGVTESSRWTPLIALYGDCSGVAYKCSKIYTGVGDDSDTDSSTAGISNQKENTFAGYFQINYRQDDFLGTDIPIDGNIGVRIVHTDYDSGEGYLKLPTISACSETTEDCTDRNEAIEFIGGTVGSNVSYEAVKSSYTNVLPSFNMRAILVDKLMLRLAYSQGLVRPDLSKMRNYTNVSFAFGEADAITGTDLTGTFATSNAKTGSGANPYLKPTYSQNYDVSLEWYFGSSSSVSLAAFHKTISNYVMSGEENMTLTRNGITETFDVSTYVNGDKGRLDGFEFSYQQFYDMLPGMWSGFGTQFNYTKLYNHGGHNSIGDDNYDDATAISYSDDSDLPMEGMSNDSYNVALMYEKYGISARVAYNWRSTFLVSSYATNLFQPVFQRNYGQVDASFLYTFLDHYKIGLQANNLFKQTTVLQIGASKDESHSFEWVEGERKLSLVMRASW